MLEEDLKAISGCRGKLTFWNNRLDAMKGSLSLFIFVSYAPIAQQDRATAS